MRLILVRHGETTWNHQGRLQGHRDSPLSANGIAQVESLRPFFQNLPRELAVVSSDLGRALETSAYLGFPAPVLDARLREMDLGDWAGKTVAELQSTSRPDYAAWRAGRLTPPNGETWESFVERVRVGLSNAIAGDTPVNVVVTHEGVVRAACMLLAGISPTRLGPPSPGTITMFDLPHRSMDDARVLALNLGPLQSRLQHQPLDLLPV